MSISSSSDNLKNSKSTGTFTCTLPAPLPEFKSDIVALHKERPDAVPPNLLVYAHQKSLKGSEFYITIPPCITNGTHPISRRPGDVHAILSHVVNGEMYHYQASTGFLTFTYSNDEKRLEGEFRFTTPGNANFHGSFITGIDPFFKKNPKSLFS